MKDFLSVVTVYRYCLASSALPNLYTLINTAGRCHGACPVKRNTCDEMAVGIDGLDATSIFATPNTKGLIIGNAQEELPAWMEN